MYSKWLKINNEKLILWASKDPLPPVGIARVNTLFSVYLVIPSDMQCAVPTGVQRTSIDDARRKIVASNADIIFF